MFIVDAHLDLAYNALNFKRDLTLPVPELRAREAGRKVGDGRITATFPSLRDAGVGLVFGTLFVMPYSRVRKPEKLTYRDSAQAHSFAMQELDYYHRLADEIPYIDLVTDLASLESVVESQSGPDNERRLGIVPLMEGADPIREPEEAELWYQRGLRVIGPAWDDTRYAAGAWRGGGGLTESGNALIEIMADLGFILDVTHMSEQASMEALDRYPGPIVATHANARSLLPSERQLSDVQIRRLAERNGVVGVVLYNRFLKRGYARTDPKESVTLADVVAHIDHICQLLGDARHVGIGSDFDGGFGAEDIPAELDSVLDLPKLATALAEWGYAEEDVQHIMGTNWLDLLRRAWSS